MDNEQRLNPSDSAAAGTSNLLSAASQGVPTVSGNPEQPAAIPPPEPAVSLAGHSHRRIIGFAVAFVLIWCAIGTSWWLARDKPKAVASVSSTSQAPTPQQPSSTVPGLQLTPSKSYGNTYANGILPVGDGKYVTSGPKPGYVYACTQYAQNLAADNGGAMVRGPWFTNNNTEWDVNKKVSVGGSVTWRGSITNTVNGTTRTIVSNDLPVGDPTGIFPIRSTDPAYQYDRNPNTITAQSYTFTLAANPTYNPTPNCIGGTVGIMLTGVEIFSAFDAGGRDAGAWEVQDGCQGHPQEQGAYHYHTLSSCIKDTSVHTVLGFALDGFPITGPTVGKNNILTTADLDECHGIVSQINLDGKSVTIYHYVMTEDFPYSVSCYHAKAIQPPGLPAQQSAQTNNQIPNQSQGQQVSPARPLGT